MAIEAMIKRGERLELVGSAADVPQIVELGRAAGGDDHRAQERSA
jgi:hypothetical protein